MNITSMTGLDFLLAMVEGSVPHPSITDTMPMRAVEVSKGFIKFVVQADKRHLNPMGGVHGGFAATVLDSVTGCAVHSVLEAGIGYGTIDLHIKMFRPIPLDTELFAEARLINISKSFGVADGSIKDAAGKLYAHGTCTCSIIQSQN